MLTMPDGIASVTNEDFGVGPLLMIRMTNGMIVAIDALNLSGEHECQVGVYANDELENPIAGISFDPLAQPEVWNNITKKSA